ncbi:MAG: hypothetical protein N2321_11665, partial [Melioribacteraceae bacterium]|nr:hypothetical protein [Melioribacteraceae bacterium]
MKKLFISTFLFVIFITIIYARSSYTGYTRKNSTVGCNCHGAANPSVIVEITGPNQVQIGKTETFQVSISGGNGSEVCVDIAASVGSLQPYDSNLKLSNNELITNGKKTYGTNGKYVYTFNYTAPNTVGQATLFATGMASKNSG